jgi:hypothetical protein
MIQASEEQAQKNSICDFGRKYAQQHDGLTRRQGVVII